MYLAIHQADAVSYYSAASGASYFPLVYVGLFIVSARRATLYSTLHCLGFFGVAVFSAVALHGVPYTNTFEAVFGGLENFPGGPSAMPAYASYSSRTTSRPRDRARVVPTNVAIAPASCEATSETTRSSDSGSSERRNAPPETGGISATSSPSASGASRST